MPHPLRAFRLRLAALLRGRRQQDDYAEELAFHQHMLREKLLREGTPATEAAAAARHAFGNPQLWHERLAELRQFRTLENIARDLAYAARVLRKSPGFTLTAILTIALGIGANTAIFSLINGLLLRPLPVPHADQLLLLGYDQDQAPRQMIFSAPLFRTLERSHPAFSSVFASSGIQLQIGAHGGGREINGDLVSGQYFSALQVPPLLGRFLVPADDQPRQNPSGLPAVLSERYWRRSFHADPHIVGQKLLANKVPFTIVGVMPERLRGTDPTSTPDVFLPLSTEPLLDAPYDRIANGYNNTWLVVLARIRDGVSPAQANASLLTISGLALRDAASDQQWAQQAHRSHFHFTCEPGSSGYSFLRMIYKKPLQAVFGMCIGMLLLACLNLASLLFARSATRQSELATRLAIGASRGRLLQQLLMESFLLSAISAIAGLIVAPFTAQALAQFLGLNNESSHVDTSLDWRVFIAAAGAAALSVVLIGIFPSIHATGKQLSRQIKAATTSRRRVSILPHIMLSLQIGLALVLVIAAGLISTSLVRIYRTGPGFDPRNINIISLLNISQQPLEGDPLLQLYHSLRDDISALPGVKGVSLLTQIPFTGSSMWYTFDKPGGGETPEIYMNRVSPDYFQTMRIPMLAGRDFSWNDTATTGKKIILSRSAAAALFPGHNPIGQHVNGTGKDGMEVIGLVGNTTYNDIREPPPIEGYMAITQSNDNKKPEYSFVARVEGPSAPFATAVRNILTREAPEIPAPVFNTLGGFLDQSLSAERMMALLSVFFAACALLVTAIGLYGTLAYNTARRTSEIGIRIALGAQRAQVVALFFRQNVAVTVLGAAAGLAAALLAARTLASFLYGTSTHDPLVLCGATLLLALVASAASLIPAIRAARIDPLTAIRTE